MKRAIARTLLLPLFFATSAIGAPINATGLKVDHQTNPVGVSNSPRLSWALKSRGPLQTPTRLPHSRRQQCRESRCRKGRPLRSQVGNRHQSQPPQVGRPAPSKPDRKFTGKFVFLMKVKPGVIGAPQPDLRPPASPRPPDSLVSKVIMAHSTCSTRNPSHSWNND